MSYPRSSASRRRGGRRRRPRRPVVLFVDDDPDQVGAFVAAMRSYDVRVVAQFTGEHGYLETLRTLPDVVVTDLRMPQGSGEMLVECLARNAETRAIPVIVISGQRREDLPGYARHLGAARFMTKPISSAALVEAIRKYVRLRPARAGNRAKQDNAAKQVRDRRRPRE